ncbi:Dabb family protein [bacterium AH-315-M05]|nr:Dabb family protein [bacterium AH-315-M05]
MIIHIAIFQWKKGTLESQINEALQEVRDLQHKIFGIKAIYCGKNFSKWAKNYTHGIVVLAENQKALDRYRNHPDHQSVASKIEFMEQDGIGVDFKS